LWPQQNQLPGELLAGTLLVYYAAMSIYQLRNQRRMEKLKLEIEQLTANIERERAVLLQYLDELEAQLEEDDHTH
jgi:hypothetical protein